MIIYSATFQNGKTYIGQTIKDLAIRISAHKRVALNNTRDQAFYRAIRKYGFESIEWEVEAIAMNQKHLNDLEKWFIASYNTMKNGYKMTTGVEHYIFCDESRQKMSVRMSGIRHPNYGKTAYNACKKASPETCRKISLAGIGRKQSEETRKKITTGLISRPVSQETKLKIRLSNLGKKRSDKTRNKISEAAKKQWSLAKEKNIPMGRQTWKGPAKKRVWNITDETRVKMSAAAKIRAKAYWAKIKNKEGVVS